MESSSQEDVSNPSASKKATSIASATTSCASRFSETLQRRAVAGVVAALALVFAFAVCPALGAAEPGDSTLERLQARLTHLQAKPGAHHVAGALEQARTALESARETEGVTAAAAASVAEAALALADRQLERRLSRMRLAEAERRLAQIEQRARAQRRALEALLRERARDVEEADREKP